MTDSGPGAHLQERFLLSEKGGVVDTDPAVKFKHACLSKADLYKSFCF